MSVTHTQIIPAQLELCVRNATGIEELSDAEVASTRRAATYTCRTIGIFATSRRLFVILLVPAKSLRSATSDQMRLLSE